MQIEFVGQIKNLNISTTFFLQFFDFTASSANNFANLR